MGLDTTAGNSLQSMTVDFQSWGCGDSGHWYVSDPADPCVTNSGNPGFTIPGGITATIYSVDTPGEVLATSTIDPTIPYRPSADSTNCTGDNAGEWFDSVAGKCRNSLSDLVTFNSELDLPQRSAHLH